MTPAQIAEARARLGLTLEALGLLLGFKGPGTKQTMNHVEKGSRNLTEGQRRLLCAYLEGYRPKDWPQ